MKHKEEVYLYILENFKAPQRLTQQGVANALGISLSTVNNALLPLRKMGAVEIQPRGLKVTDAEKILLYWATIRKLQKDFLFSCRVRLPVKQIENTLPAGVVFTAFSGYKFKFNDVPADYSEVYAYCPADTLEEAKRRFKPAKGPANLFLLKSTNVVEKMGKNGISPASLLFVDAWNCPGWYGKDFLNALREKLRYG